MKESININFHRLNHLQICIPKNKEPEARAFYCQLIGLKEIEKPEYLRKNGGFWLSVADIELHIGAEDQINQSKRHPAFEVDHLNCIKQAFRSKNIKIKEDKSLPEFNRFSFYDPFNNRIELLEKKTWEELNLLGQQVTVKVDRPMNSKHPDFNYEYPVNYGFIPNTTGGDGKEVDAYILGETTSLAEFSGIVKAVIVRYNDQENKLVVANADLQLDETTIEQAIHFQEQFFDTEIKLMES